MAIAGLASGIGNAVGGIGNAVGASVSSANEARAVEGCGKQPSCWGNGPICSEKKQVFNACVKREQDIKMAMINAQNNQTRSASEDSSKRTKTIIIAVVVVIALVLIMKR